MVETVSKISVANQGLVVQSIVSVIKLLVKDRLSLIVLTKPIVVIFFVEKLEGSFALHQLGCRNSPNFFRQKNIHTYYTFENLMSR